MTAASVLINLQPGGLALGLAYLLSGLFHAGRAPHDPWGFDHDDPESPGGGARGN
jgi:hypothetical protein